MSRSDRRLLSLVFLSFGVMENFGSLSPAAFACVLVSLGLCIHSFSGPSRDSALPRWTGIVILVALAGTTLLYNNGLEHHVFLVTFGILTAAILIYSLIKRPAAKAAAFVLAALSAVLGMVANMTWGFADIDVFHFQQDASQALLHGQNPYSPVVASPEMVAPGMPAMLHLHFPYGPILPVLEAPFRLLGDIRILHIAAALVLSLAVLALARRAGTLDRTACVVMAFPLTLGMVLFSWVDVITMAGLAVWIVNFRSHPRVATFALVVALGAKPTTLIALVPMLFWSVRARRQAIISAAVTAVVVLPFAIVTGLSQFYYNVLGVQLDVFPRFDALTVNSLLNGFHLPILPFAVSALCIAVTAVLVLRRRPNTYGELLTGTAILATVSFLVAKWAFFNYYYIPGVLLMLAIAGNSLAVDVPEMIRPPAILVRAAGWLRGATGHVTRAPGRLPRADAPLGTPERRLL